MRDEGKASIPSISNGKKAIEKVTKRFDTVIDSLIMERLRNSERKKIADALYNAQQKVLSNNSLSDEQKYERIGMLNEIGEESSKKKPDINFFAKFRDLMNTEISLEPFKPTKYSFRDVDWTPMVEAIVNVIGCMGDS